MRWLKRVAIALVLLCALGGAVVLAYDHWGDGPRAERALRRGDNQEALRLYNKALDDKRFINNFWSNHYRSLITAYRGEAYSHLNQLDAALADLNQAIKLNPDWPWFYSVRARLYAKRLEWAPAISDASKVISMQPDNVILLDQRAWLYRSTLDHGRAAADYAAIRKIDPSDRSAYFSEALARKNNGETDKARAVVAEMPVRGGYDAEDYTDRAGITDLIGERERAMLDYDRAIKLAPRNPNVFIERGSAFSNDGMSQQALQDYSRSIELDPKFTRGWAARGRENYMLGNYRAAQADLKHANELQPDLPYPMIWLHLANIRFGTDDRETIKVAQAAMNQNGWPRPILEFFTGRLDESALRQTAREKVSPLTVVEQTCEVNFYVGSLHLAKGERAKALPMLRDAAAKCPLGFIELGSARQALKRLGE